MTNRLLFATLIGCIAPTLAACNSGAVQASAPVDAGAASFAQDRAEISPNAEKKVGHYVWVWHTERVNDYAALEADCPANYSVVGGGYHLGVRHTAYVDASRPNNTFTGWVVIVTTRTPRARGTIYAACAPI